MAASLTECSDPIMQLSRGQKADISCRVDGWRQVLVHEEGHDVHIGNVKRLSVESDGMLWWHGHLFDTPHIMAFMRRLGPQRFGNVSGDFRPRKCNCCEVFSLCLHSLLYSERLLDHLTKQPTCEFCTEEHHQKMVKHVGAYRAHAARERHIAKSHAEKTTEEASNDRRNGDTHH